MTFSPSQKDAMLAELRRSDTTVELDPNSQWPFGGGLNYIGEGTTIDGHGATLTWASQMGRFKIDHAPGVTIKNLNLIGWVNIHNLVSGNFTVEDVLIRNSYGGVPWLDLGGAGGATGAFNVQGDHGVTLADLTFRRCVSDHAYHHGYNLNLQEHNEGGGFKNVLYEDCQALSPGSGFEGHGASDWSAGFDIPDAGDIENLTVRRGRVDDAWQSGFHLDGSWTDKDPRYSHKQDQVNVLFEDCIATNCGRRCAASSTEKYRDGFYVQTGRLINCRTENCANAGFGIKNEIADSLVVEGCVDIGSAYGMILEWPGTGAKVEFTSKGAKQKAFQGQVTGSGTLDLTVIDPPTHPILFGRTIRHERIDCPNHWSDSVEVTKYDNLGYALTGANITIRGPSNPGYDIWQASRMNGTPTYSSVYTEPPETGGGGTTGSGAIQAGSVPSGAMVQIDGVAKGPTPCRIANVAAGSHRARFALAGFADFEQAVTVAANETAAVTAVLTPAVPVFDGALFQNARVTPSSGPYGTRFTFIVDMRRGPQ